MELSTNLKKTPAAYVAAYEIDLTFKSSCIDLVSSALGGHVLTASDEWFAAAENILTPTPPIRQPGKMVYTGAWYDGWETRRHNPEPFDWAIIRLGVASGTVEGVEIDTAHFVGNHAPAISIEGCFHLDDNEVVSWQGSRGGWETILGLQECGPSQRQAWKLDRPTLKRYTHVRLSMYPDGGIARFRLYGHAVPVFPKDPNAIFDLAAAQNGGMAVSCSNEHFSSRANLLLPGRGKDMGDGWETARSREKNHVDWVIVRLGTPGFAKTLIVDTAHFRGNFPKAVRIEGIFWERNGDPQADSPSWEELVGDTPCKADTEHEWPSRIQNRPLTHVKLVMIPDGGVKRFRVLGRRVV